MLVIRRMDDGKRSYTAIFLPGEPAQVFPTSDREHARILEIYKQDKPYEDVLNDFTDFGLVPVRPEKKKPAAKRNGSRPKRGKNGTTAT